MDFRSIFSLLFLIFCLSANAQTEQITVEKIQKSLVTERTATWCPVCGAADVWPILKRIKANYGDKAVVIAGHNATTSELHRPIAIEFLENLELSYSQPRFYFNNEYIGNRGTTTEERLAEKINQAFETEPIAQTGMFVSYDNSRRLLDIDGRAEFFQNVNGKYFLAYYLVLKSVFARQAAIGEEANHENILWDAITDGAFGAILSDNGAKAKEDFLLRKQYTLPEDININNIMVVAIIWKEKGAGKYGLINVESTDEIQMKTVSQAFEWKAIQSFGIQPTVTETGSIAAIELNSSLEQTNISIYNEHGQMVKNIFSGDLPKGRHQFPIQMNAAGMYFATVKSGQYAISRRFIKINN